MDIVPRSDLPWYARLACIVIGAIIVFLVFGTLNGVFGQEKEPPQPITFETVETPVCNIQHSKPDKNIMPVLLVKVGITFKDGTTWWKPSLQTIIPIKYHLEAKNVRDQWRARFNASVKALEVCGMWDLDLHIKMEEAEERKQLASKRKK